MLRIVLGVIVGYVVTVVVVAVGLMGMWAVLGGDRAFQPDSNVASMSWSLGAIVGGFIAAIVGGLVAAVVGGGRGMAAAKALAVIMLAVGWLGAVANLVVEREAVEMPEDRASMTFFEAGQLAQSPAWYNFVIPVVGAVGVMIGARLKGGGGATAARD